MRDKPKVRPDPVVKRCRFFPLASRENFSLLLRSISLPTALEPSDFNVTVKSFYDKVFRAYDLSFPIQPINARNTPRNPWITPGVCQCIRKKHKLYKLFLNGSVSKRDYTWYRNRLTLLLRRAKSFYFSKLFFDNAKNTTATWRHIGNLVNNNVRVELKALVNNNQTLAGQDLADFVNNYFVNSSVEITEGLPDLQYTFRSTPVEQSCFLMPAVNSEVCSTILELNKCLGIYDISTHILEHSIDYFTSSLTSLFNQAICFGLFPDIFKLARVTPIFKGGSHVSVSNYRPISSLPTLSKVLEKLLLSRLSSFADRFDLFTPMQFGFRKGRDTTQAIVRVLSPVFSALQSNKFVACFFLDIRKAFDTVDHTILLTKLSHYGYRGTCEQLLRSYVTGRSQYVSLNDFSADPLPITKGVPQGSILGPFLFGLYINDIVKFVEPECVLFADDAAFVVVSSSSAGLTAKIEKLFSDLELYLKLNKLVPNLEKSKLMAFSIRKPMMMPSLRFSGVPIEWVTDIRYLGLTLSSNLSYSNHICTIERRLSSMSGVLGGLKKYLPVTALFTILNAYVLPHLSMHLLLWGSSPRSHVSKLEVKLNQLLRTILGVTYSEGVPDLSNNELYSQLHCLKLAGRYKLALFKFSHRMVMGSLPLFYDVLKPHIAQHDYYTRGSLFRHLPLSSELDRRFVPHQAVKLIEDYRDYFVEPRFNVAVKMFKQMLLLSQ